MLFGDVLAKRWVLIVASPDRSGLSVDESDDDRG